MGRLTNNLLFKDRCALPDQMSFVLTFPWGGFVLAMRNRDCTNLDEISILAFSVTTKDLVFHHMESASPWGAFALFLIGFLVGFESKCSFDISAAVYRMPPITLIVAARACSGRNLCRATNASRSVGQSVEIAPL
jgi:hypothetical protein